MCAINLKQSIKFKKIELQLTNKKDKIKSLEILSESKIMHKKRRTLDNKHMEQMQNKIDGIKIR